MPWIIPENKLDVQQRSFLDNLDLDRKSIWIKGFAGSGKSILLLYTIKRILLREPQAKIALVVFTHSLVEMFRASIKELGCDGQVEIMTYYKFLKYSRKYDYILCDEVQDLTPRVIRAMTSCGDHIIVAGDANQSIYTVDPQGQEPTVTVDGLSQLIGGGPFELGIIHRLSRSLINAVQKLLPQMNIFTAKRDMTKSDTQIRLCRASNQSQEVGYVLEQATKAVDRGYTAAILFSSSLSTLEFVNIVLKSQDKPIWIRENNEFGKPDWGALNSHLITHGLKLQYLGNGYGSFEEGDRRVILMTYHSAKGLDFDNVFMPFLNNNVQISQHGDEHSKTLLMVAMTRTRNNLYLSYNSSAFSTYLDSLAGDCAHIDVATATKISQTPTDNIFGF